MPTRTAAGAQRSSTVRPTTARGAFTLVELLIVIVILGILAALVFPKYSSLDNEARAKSCAANVRKVREMVQIHRHSGDYPLNAAGNPAQVHADWFRGDELPEHPWTTAPFRIGSDAAGSEAIYPAVKTFDPNDPNADSAWYNTDNGAFCARVPPQATDAETLALFNLANSAAAGGLGDTQ